MRASCVRGRRSIAKTTRTPRTMASPIAVVAITFPRSDLPSLMINSQDSHISHIVKVPAQPIASMTTKGMGSSSSIPRALKIARAASANARPTSAQTIQDGKYEPRIRSEEHTSELQSPQNLVCRPLLEKKLKYTDTSWLDCWKSRGHATTLTHTDQ